MIDFTDLTIESAHRLLQKKELSSVRLTQKYIDRAHKFNKQLNSYITILDKIALEKAKKADALIADGQDIDCLTGIPIAAKDLFSTKGIKTTAGSKVLENYIPPYSATVIKKLSDSNAILIGKTNMDAWGHGSSGENSDFGPTKNPYDTSRVPGGSSSGSAVAVASGTALGALGTDTGSSVRLPAAYCNLVGLKPTFGRVSRSGVIAMASSLDSVGHLTKTVHDNALMLNVTAGGDKYDSTCKDSEVEDFTKNIQKGVMGVKIGLSKEYFQGLNKDIKELTLKAVKILEKMGAKISEISLPHTKYAVATYYIIQPSEVSSNLARFDGIRFGSGRESFSQEAKRRIILGTYTLSAGYYEAFYLKAMKVRRLIKEDFENAFKKVDLIISPTSPTLPFKIGEKASDPLKMYLSDVFLASHNLAGVPSLSIPCGFINKLPVGMQIVGPQFGEQQIYQAAYAHEQETLFYKQGPKI